MSKGSLTEGQDFSVVFDPSSEEVVLLVLVGLGDISTTVLYSEPEPVADSEDDEDSDISGSGDGLSKGQLAGIIIAAVLGSLVIIGVAGVGVFAVIMVCKSGAAASSGVKGAQHEGGELEADTERGCTSEN